MNQQGEDEDIGKEVVEFVNNSTIQNRAFKAPPPRTRNPKAGKNKQVNVKPSPKGVIAKPHVKPKPGTSDGGVVNKPSVMVTKKENVTSHSSIKHYP